MLGIFSALGASISWTLACYIWRAQSFIYTSNQLNYLKNIIAFTIYSPLLITIDWKTDWKHIALLLISGILGIAIGDSLYILSLKFLGTRLTLTFEAISPILATIFGKLFLEEELAFNNYLGSIIVVISLITISLQKVSNQQKQYSIKVKKIGYLFALLSILTAITAGMISRYVLTISDLSPFETTEIRLIGAIIFLVPIVRFQPIKKFLKTDKICKRKLVLASFLGTNIGILLQQIVFKELPIGVGWTLLSSTSLYSLIFARFEGDKINIRIIFLSFITILGVYICLV